MPLANYGILKCTYDWTDWDDESVPYATNHVRIPVLVDRGNDEPDEPYRLEIQIGAERDPTFRCYIDFHLGRRSLLCRLKALPPGFTLLASKRGSGALDLLHNRLLDRREILTVGDGTTPNREEIWSQLRDVMRNAYSIYAFGTLDQKRRALSRIHMNQGSPPSGAGHDGAYQDGALLVQPEENSKWLAAFFFLSLDQSIRTDRKTGHALPYKDEKIAEAPPLDKPVYRPLKVYAFDPSRGKNLGNIMTVQVEYERLRPGPTGKRVSVIDYDLSNDCFYKPVDLDDPETLIRGGLDPSESDPRFHQQMVYAVVNETLRRFEKAYGRRLPSASEGAPFARYQKLRVIPHAMQSSNAFYSRRAGALLFGYFAATEDTTGPNLPRQTIFTCFSYDVVSHETAHAILERVRGNYCLPTNFDVPAFHEGFADLLALLHHFSYKEALRQTIQRTGGELHRFRMKPEVAPGDGGPVIQSEIGADNPLVELARQFGDATGMRAALRSAIGARPIRMIITRQLSLTIRARFSSPRFSTPSSRST